ncbi:Uncharacterized protein FKW44_016387 [Caligus rogercresseyi]|uniref:Uncharacterized protein n=1 Tax=Caligus rogercresseyi TaxID=217165 RepID=A0A7T8K141_CALRO|nr:Uncharacterized protein FKW44_016387 [Caligus rogercresseyi]
MKHNGSTVRIFSDKKLWTVDQVRNSRNDRYLAYCIEEPPPPHHYQAPSIGYDARSGQLGWEQDASILVSQGAQDWGQ